MVTVLGSEFENVTTLHCNFYNTTHYIGVDPIGRGGITSTTAKTEINAIGVDFTSIATYIDNVQLNVQVQTLSEKVDIDFNNDSDGYNSSLFYTNELAIITSIKPTYGPIYMGCSYITSES